MRHVLVTTINRLVMMGILEAQEGTSVTLTEARNCLYWSNQVRGVFGLAAVGPDVNCRVGRAVPRISLTDVTSITDCTPEAVAAWEAEPWNN